MDKSLEDKLASYHKAIQQEYATIEAAMEEGTPTALRDAARKTLASNFTEYLQELTFLATGAESEGTRLSAVRYILGFLMSDVEKTEDDTINDLIAQLTGAAAKD